MYIFIINIGLIYLDLSENYLDFKDFHMLPNLKELRIACMLLIYIL